MTRLLAFFIAAMLPFSALGAAQDDHPAIQRAVRDYIESQHKAEPELMQRGVDKELAKRTYWQAADGTEFIMKTDFDSMMKVAKTYNMDGTKFPKVPRVEIKILDVDNRVASVKLTADEWIDYMHLYKTDRNEWKILNVLWQYHDSKRHSSKK